MSDEIHYFDRILRVKDLSQIQEMGKGIVLIPVGEREYDVYVPNKDGEYLIVSRYGEINAVKRQH